jgi:hypothetical protein
VTSQFTALWRLDKYELVLGDHYSSAMIIRIIKLKLRGYEQEILNSTNLLPARSFLSILRLKTLDYWLMFLIFRQFHLVTLCTQTVHSKWYIPFRFPHLSGKDWPQRSIVPRNVLHFYLTYPVWITSGMSQVFKNWVFPKTGVRYQSLLLRLAQP